MNVLILSSSDKVYSASPQLLGMCGNHRVPRAETVQQAKVLVGQREFGAAIVYADSRDAGYREVCLLLAANCVATLFVPRGEDEMPYDLCDRGVVIAERPLTKATLFIALRCALGIAYGYEKLRLENSELKERLEALRVVSRAKCILARRGMTEDEAHKEIERRAMNERRTKTDIAKEIIEGNDVQ